MRSGIIGFLLGAIMVLLAAIGYQLEIIKASADDFKYRFAVYVFSDTKFPWGYLEQGRVIKRTLFPVKITTTFYDAKYNEVTQADKPGRYGAVVKMVLNGGVVEYRFITLYRTPEKIFWSDGATPATIAAQLPPGIGVDPLVVQKQSAEIGAAINWGFFGDGNVSPDLAVLLAGLSETSPDDPTAVVRTNVEARDADWWYGLRQRLGLIEPYPYLVDLPQGYEADPARKWALILYLHSGSQKGHDLQQVRASGLAAVIAQGHPLPAIVISPQCSGSDWSIPQLNHLLDDVSAKYRVDADRVYLTGISMGGDAVWNLAAAHPERFAAIAPIAGDGDPADVVRLKDLPTWDFHGMKDDIAPPQNPIAVVKALRLAGGHVHQTLFPNAGHYDSWGLAYGTDALYPWLLAQKRGQPEVLTTGVPTP